MKRPAPAGKTSGRRSSPRAGPDAAGGLVQFRRSMGSPRLVWALARRPWLWPVAASQASRFAEDGWWRRRPFLPLPDPGLVRFRLDAMYRDPAARMPPDDMVRWLRWCRIQNAQRRRQRRDIRPRRRAA